MASPTQGSSLSAFLTSLIINGLIFLAFFVLFLLLRKKYKRIYEPRTFLGTVPDAERTEPLSGSKFSWIIPLLKSPDPFIIDHSGLDAYFFLRYLRMMMILFLVGCVMTFPVLFPVNATGGGGQAGLDVLTFANIAVNKNRYFAQVFIGWLFIGFTLWYLTRELLDFKKTRQEYLRRPGVASRLVQRTILVTSIPKDMLTVEKLTEVFGPHVERVWINRNYKKLQKLIDDRNKDSITLENSETKLIKKCNKIAIKKGKKDIPEGYDKTISTLYLPDKKRPHHRLGYPVVNLLFGKKVDSINWSRSELARLNPEIAQKQSSHESYGIVPSAFITFTSLSAAHKAAQQKLPTKGIVPFKLERTLSPQPGEIIWSNMRISYAERAGRFVATTAFVTAMVIFWAIPVAFVGTISNINYLTNKVHFLKFILSIPPVVLGVITGLLPSVMLAILMALLPIILRCMIPNDATNVVMAKWSGVPTLSKVELVVQNTYFLFQVIQVFLVTALASSASAAVTQIIANPSSATQLLATNLPKSSNFYISYILLQGLSIAGGAFLQIVGLFLFYLLGKLFDNTPRKMWTRWNILSGLGWGTVFPIYTNLAVIAITYSIMSPLILIFAAGAFGLLYFAYLYNFLYVYNQSIDTGGMIFPRAVWQTFTGIYILEICMTGLFGIRSAVPEIVLFAITIPITAVYQVLLQWKIEKKLEYIDLSVEDVETGETRVLEGNSKDEKNRPVLDTQRVVNAESDANVSEVAPTEEIQAEEVSEAAGQPVVTNTQGPQQDETGPDNYHHPALTARVPIIWIPQDPLGISKEEIRDTEACGDIKITDGGASLDEKNKLGWTQDPPDYAP